MSSFILQFFKREFCVLVRVAPVEVFRQGRHVAAFRITDVFLEGDGAILVGVASAQEFLGARAVGRRFLGGGFPVRIVVGVVLGVKGPGFLDEAIDESLKLLDLRGHFPG